MSEPPAGRMGRRAKIKIVHLTVGDVKAYAGNPRKHTKTQIAKLAKSIEEHGWTSPIVVDGDHVILAGHGRLAAAERLGLATVPCVVRADLSPAAARAVRLADNKLAELSSWDNALLGVEVAELGDVVDLASIGFTHGELAALGADATATTAPMAR